PVFVHFARTVCVCLPPLHSAESIAQKLRFRLSTRVCVTVRRREHFRILVLVEFRWESTGRSFSPCAGHAVIPLLSCGWRIFLLRTRLDALGRFSARLSTLSGGDVRDPA